MSKSRLNVGKALADTSLLKSETFKEKIRGAGKVDRPTVSGATKFAEDTIVDTSNVLATAVGSTLGKTTGKIFDITGKEKIISPSFIGERIGSFLEDPSTIKNVFKRRVEPEVVFDLDSGVARLTTSKDFERGPLTDRLPSSQTITRTAAVAAAEFTGSVATKAALFTTPVVGASLFAAEVSQEIRPFNFNPVAFAKEKPLQAGLLVGTVGTLGALKTASVLRRTRVQKVGDDLVFTSRANQLLGQTVRVSSKKGTSILSRKFKLEVIPAREKLRISTRKIGSGSAGDTLKEIQSTIASGSDEATLKLLGTRVTPIKDTRSALRIIEEGSQKIVTKPVRARLRIDRTGISALGGGDKLISSGLSPFTKAGRIERAAALSELKGIGFTGKQGKELLRFKAPRVTETKGTITGLSILNDKGSKLSLKEIETTSFPKVEFEGFSGKVTSRGGKKIVKTKEVDLVPSTKTLESGETIFEGLLTSTNTAKQLGKQTESFKVATAVRKIGSQQAGISATEVAGVGTVSKPITLEFFQSGTALKDITGGRFLRDTSKIEFSLGRIVAKKPTPRTIDLDKALGLEESSVKFIRGAGKKSSKQFLQSLQINTNELKAAGFGTLKKAKPTPKGKATGSSSGGSGTVAGLSDNLPSFVGGTGLKNLPRPSRGFVDVAEVTQLPPTAREGILSSSKISLSSTPQATTLNSFLQTDSKLKTLVGIKSDIRIADRGKLKIGILGDLRSDSRIRIGSRTKVGTRIGEKIKILQPKQELKLQQKQLQELQITPLGARLRTPRIKQPKPKIKEPKPFKFRLDLKTTKEPASSGGLFSVAVRRRGRFRTIGKGLSLKQATAVGKQRVSSTLAATFKIEGLGKAAATPKGFRRGKGLGTFIERRGLRLSTGTETKEILQSKRRLRF